MTLLTVLSDLEMKMDRWQAIIYPLGDDTKPDVTMCVSRVYLLFIIVAFLGAR